MALLLFQSEREAAATGHSDLVGLGLFLCLWYLSSVFPVSWGELIENISLEKTKQSFTQRLKGRLGAACLPPANLGFPIVAFEGCGLSGCGLACGSVSKMATSEVPSSGPATQRPEF